MKAQIMLTYKFRMYPKSKQEALLKDNLEVCRKLYNDILARIAHERDRENKISMVDTQNLIPRLKKQDPNLNNVYSKVLQMVNHTLWKNIKGLARLRNNGKKIGKLRFKSRRGYKTLNFNQSGFHINEKANRINFSKIGNVRTIIHRKIDGKVKGIIIKKTNTGKWYANVQVQKDQNPLPSTGKDIGLDVGISMFVTDSDKNEFQYAKNIDKTLVTIKKHQRELSSKKKGSANRRKVIQQLALTYETLKHQRIDYLHKVSTFYIQNYDFIAHENLNIQGMLQAKRSRTLNRHILDTSWRTFFKMLEVKAESAGRKVVKVNPKNTTQKCSICKTVVPKKLSNRKHKCACGHEVPRDYNSAQNILFDGYYLAHRSAGRTSLLVEKNPLLKTISVSDIVSGKIFR